MRDGIYKLVFNTNVNTNGQLSGILIVREGAINGGDYVCYYKGQISGNKASVTSIPHNKNDTTAFNGHAPLDLELTLEDHDNHYLFKGYLKSDPTKTILGQLNFLSKLA